MAIYVCGGALLPGGGYLSTTAAPRRAREREARERVGPLLLRRRLRVAAVVRRLRLRVGLVALAVLALVALVGEVARKLRAPDVESCDLDAVRDEEVLRVLALHEIAVAAAAGVASKGQDITTGLSAMASATPTGVDAIASSTSNLTPPSLPSLESDIPLDLPKFDNSLLDLQGDDAPPYDQPTIQGLISDEHRNEH